MGDFFEIDGLDNFDKAISKMIKNTFPKESKSFIQKEGNKLRKKTLAKAKMKVKQKTGNYYNNIKRGKVYTFKGNGALATRVYGGGKAPHTHLLEYGHRLIVGKGKNAKEIGFVEGYHIFEEAGREFEEQYAKDCDNFAGKIAKELEK